MRIILNGKDEIIEDGATLARLVALKGMKPETIIVEHNLDIVRKEDWSNIVIKEDDRLEILRFVGGG